MLSDHRFRYRHAKECQPMRHDLLRVHDPLDAAALLAVGGADALVAIVPCPNGHIWCFYPNPLLAAVVDACGRQRPWVAPAFVTMVAEWRPQTQER
jgi:hypothetical protein